MNKSEKELVDLIKEWKDEIKAIAEDYQVAIAELAKVRSDYKKDRVKQFIPFIPTIVSALLVLIVVWVLVSQGKNIACGSSYEFAGVKVSRDCPIETNQQFP